MNAQLPAGVLPMRRNDLENFWTNLEIFHYKIVLTCTVDFTKGGEIVEILDFDS